MRKLLALCLLLFTFTCFAGDDSMPAFVLFKLVDSPDPSDPMTYGKGCPIQVSDRDIYVGSQVLPIFGQIEITNANVGTIRDAFLSILERLNPVPRKPKIKRLEIVLLHMPTVFRKVKVGHCGDIKNSIETIERKHRTHKFALIR